MIEMVKQHAESALARPGGIVAREKGRTMEKLYKVTFTHRCKKYEVILEADCKADAIAQAQEIGFGEDWEAVLVAVDGEPVNGMKASKEE